MFGNLFNKLRKNAPQLARFIRINPQFSRTTEDGMDYICIPKSATQDDILALLKVLSIDNIEFTFHDTIHPTFSDPGAYFSYSRHKAPSPDAWSMCVGNHGWSGGIYHIQNQIIIKQVFNLVQKDKIDRIQISRVAFWHDRELVSPGESEAENRRLSAIHD